MTTKLRTIKRPHASKRRPVVYISIANGRQYGPGWRFHLTVCYSNGRSKHHGTTYANSQVPSRAARSFYPECRIERVS